MLQFIETYEENKNHNPRLNRRAKNKFKDVILKNIKVQTSFLRKKPDFLIVGAQKCGTTSLFGEIKLHPNFLSNANTKKEIHYFDNYYHYGKKWYLSNFPLKEIFYKDKNDKKITGEASPYYMFHPHSIRRIHNLFPSMKLIVMLRNPIDRAFSHYNHMVRYGLENLTFEDALKAEEGRIKKDKHLFRINDYHYGHSHRTYSYKNRGFYINQILNIRKYFPAEQLLIIKSEDYYKNPKKIHDSISLFLNISKFPTLEKITKNKGNYKSLSEKIRNKISLYFEPYNEKLYRYLDQDFDWK